MTHANRSDEERAGLDGREAGAATPYDLGFHEGQRQAVAAERVRLAEAVRALPIGPMPTTGESVVYGYRAAVLALLKAKPLAALLLLAVLFAAALLRRRPAELVADEGYPEMLPW